jgi:hypothetical protein
LRKVIAKLLEKLDAEFMAGVEPVNIDEIADGLD